MRTSMPKRLRRASRKRKSLYDWIAVCSGVYVMLVPVGVASKGLPVDSASLATDQISCSAQIISSFAWPVAFVILIFVLRFWPGIEKLFGIAPKVIRGIDGPFGVKIAIDATAAKEVRGAFDRSFSELKDQADEEFKHVVEYARIRLKIANVVSSALPDVLSKCGLPSINMEKTRVTVHIQDVVFAQYLYQLTEYYPDPGGGGKAGRRFSQRYGIIGRAWRLQESLGKGNALPNATDPSSVKRALITDWGMYEEEAIPGSHGRPSYLCVMLKNDDEICGILFLDSKTKDLFGSDEEVLGKKTADEVAKLLEAHNKCRDLAKSISVAIAPMRAAGPFLKVST